MGVIERTFHMLNLVKAPLRASRHLAVWVVWQSTGVTLIPAQRR